VFTQDHQPHPPSQSAGVKTGNATPALGVTLLPLVATLDYSDLYRQCPPLGGRATHRGVRSVVDSSQAIGWLKKLRIIKAPFLGSRHLVDDNANNNTISSRSLRSINDASDITISRSRVCQRIEPMVQQRLQSVGLVIPPVGGNFNTRTSVSVSQKRFISIYQEEYKYSTIKQTQIRWTVTIPKILIFLTYKENYLPYPTTEGFPNLIFKIVLALLVRRET